MATFSSPTRPGVPTFVEHRNGQAVRCHRVSDAELAQLVRDCDEWEISAPQLFEGRTGSLQRIDRRLSYIRAGGDYRCKHVSEHEGVYEHTFLLAERIDLALVGQIEIYAGTAQRKSTEGNASAVLVVVLAPDVGPVCNLVIAI